MAREPRVEGLNRVAPSPVARGEAPGRPSTGRPEDQRDCSARAHGEDVNQDGRLDLLFQFSTQQSGIDPGDTQACLTGRTFTGVKVEGCDTIRLIG